MVNGIIRLRCRQCDRYETMGWGNACPCVHVDGRCMTPEREMFKVYSIYDQKLQEFGQLAVSRNDEAMRRAVLDGVRGSNSMIEKYPSDYVLYRVGEFDQGTGFLCGFTTPPVLVCNIADLMGAAGPQVVRDAGA